VRRAAIVYFSLVLPLLVAEAQDPHGVQPPSRLKVGVALSGGGVKGFAHVGALRVIEDVGLPIDVVTGTSMGSFIGGLYAVGYSVDEIDSVLHSIDWREMFEDRGPRSGQSLDHRLVEEGRLLTLPLRGGQIDLPRGLIFGQRISQELARLFFRAWDARDFQRLPIPFGAVAADLADGQGILLTSGYLPEAIRASTSLPSVFDPIAIDGRTLIDGGVTRNLPAEDALSLGADVLICVDVSEPVLPVDSLRTLIDVMVQAVGFRMLESARKQRGLCDVLIMPDMKGVDIFDLDRTDELIARGEKASDEVRRSLQALLASIPPDTTDRKTRRPSLLRRPDSVYINALTIEGASGANQAAVRRAMRLSLPVALSSDDLDRVVERVYNTQRFSRVTYRLEPRPAVEEAAVAAMLVVNVVEAEGDRMSVGLRYDSDYQAAILARFSFADVFGYNTRLVANLRLGELVRLGGTLTTPMGFGPRARLLSSAEISRTPIDLFSGGVRTSSVVVHILEGGLSVGGLLRPYLAASLGIRGELYDLDPRIAGETGVSFSFLDETSSLVLAEGQLRLDTFDRLTFPTRGTKLSVRSTVSIGPLSSDTFGQHSIDVESRFPFGSRLSFVARAVAGRTFGTGTPIHYRFFAGGLFPLDDVAGRHIPLLGYELQELAGVNMRALRAGLQFEIRQDVFLGAMWNAAAAGETWSWPVEPGDFAGGIGFSAGVRSPVGPVILMLTSGGTDGPYELHLSVGHFF
jgi:NTE family protein